MISIDGSSLDSVMVVIIIVAAVLANAATGALSEIGWKSAILKDLEICRRTKEAATGEEQETIAKKFSDDVYSRILRKTLKRKGYDKIRKTALSLVPEYLMSTAVIIFVLAAISRGNALIEENLSAFTVSAIATGFAMLIIESVLKSSRSRKRNNVESKGRNDKRNKEVAKQAESEDRSDFRH